MTQKKLTPIPIPLMHFVDIKLADGAIKILDFNFFSSLEITTTVEGVSTYTLVLTDTSFGILEDEIHKFMTAQKPKSTLEISYGYRGESAPVSKLLSGSILPKIDYSLDVTKGEVITITGILGPAETFMSDATKPKVWQQKKISDIVQAICDINKDNWLTNDDSILETKENSKMPGTDELVSYAQAKNVSDVDFMKYLAQFAISKDTNEGGYKVFFEQNEEGKDVIRFRPLEKNEEAVETITLYYGQNTQSIVKSFDFSLNTLMHLYHEGTGDISNTAFSIYEKKPYARAEKQDSGETKFINKNKVNVFRSKKIRDSLGYSYEQFLDLLYSTKHKIGGRLITGQLTVLGHPEFKPRQMIYLIVETTKGEHKVLSGRYIIDKVVHKINKSTFETILSVRTDSIG